MSVTKQIFEYVAGKPNAPVPAQARSSYQNEMCHNPLEISYNDVFRKGYGPCR